MVECFESVRPFLYKFIIMKMQIETPRLLLRPFQLSDASANFKMDSNPNVIKYLPVEPHVDIEQSIALVKNVIQQYEDFGIGRVAVELKETGEYIGWSGFKLHTDVMNNHKDFYELGYRFQEEYWGKGYATEAAKACMKYGFEVLKLDVIYAVAYANHSASLSVLKKAGFQFVETFMEDGELHHWLKCRNV